MPASSSKYATFNVFVIRCISADTPNKIGCCNRTLAIATANFRKHQNMCHDLEK